MNDEEDAEDKIPAGSRLSTPARTREALQAGVHGRKMLPS